MPSDATSVNMRSPMVIAREEVVKRLRANMRDDTPEWERLMARIQELSAGQPVPDSGRESAAMYGSFIGQPVQGIPAKPQSGPSNHTGLIQSFNS